MSTPPPCGFNKDRVKQGPGPEERLGQRRGEEEEHRGEGWNTGLQVLPLPQPKCKMQGESLRLLKPQFPLLENQGEELMCLKLRAHRGFRGDEMKSWTQNTTQYLSQG